jgi:hypothetical protein
MTIQRGAKVFTKFKDIVDPVHTALVVWDVHCRQKFQPGNLFEKYNTFHR